MPPLSGGPYLMPRKQECKFIEWEAEEEEPNEEEDSQEESSIEGEFDDFINDDTESEYEEEIRISAREKRCSPDELLNLRDRSPAVKRRRVFSESSSEDDDESETEDGELIE